MVEASAAAASSVLFVGSVQLWPLSESVSNLCLCFRTCESAASQHVQSSSVCVNSDQVTEQSKGSSSCCCCKLLVEKNSTVVFSYNKQA